MLLLRHGESYFNQSYNRTRIDPDIRDAELTERGREQARAAAEAARPLGIKAIVASPYRRALQTAEIVAGQLKLEVEVDPVVGERAAFSCDVGSPRSELALAWPALRFDHLDEEWWPALEESHDAISQRCAAFRQRTDALTHRANLLVVSHWGFINALTGLPVPNCALVRFEIAPAVRAEILHPL